MISGHEGIMKIGQSIFLIIFQLTAVCGFADDRPVPGESGVSSQVLLADKSGASSTNQPAEEKKGAAKAPETGKSVTKPLRPFTPSERIKTDQAVDFPYDI